MNQLIAKIREKLQSGEAVMLCSILQSDGSTPRSTGAKMAVFQDGSSIGTVGGGTLERLVTLRAVTLLQSGRSGSITKKLLYSR